MSWLLYFVMIVLQFFRRRQKSLNWRNCRLLKWLRKEYLPLTPCLKMFMSLAAQNQLTMKFEKILYASSMWLQRKYMVTFSVIYCLFFWRSHDHVLYFLIELWFFLSLVRYHLCLFLLYAVWWIYIMYFFLILVFSDKSKDIPVVVEFGSFVMDLFSTTSDLDLSVNFSSSADFPREKKIQTLRKFARKLYAIQSIVSSLHYCFYL